MNMASIIERFVLQVSLCLGVGAVDYDNVLPLIMSTVTNDMETGVVPMKELGVLFASSFLNISKANSSPEQTMGLSAKGHVGNDQQRTVVP